MADQEPPADRDRRAGRPGALAIAALAMAGAAAMLVLWLVLTAADTMEGLQAEADRQGLRAELAVPPSPPQPASVETAAVPGAADASPEPAPPEAAQPPTEAPQATAPQAAAPETATPPAEQPAAEPAPPPPADTADIELAAPDPALIEESEAGPLPRIAADGREPWQVYARPFTAGDAYPRIAIVVTDLGQSAAMTEEAIRTMPGPVTLAFAPYASELQEWLPQARRSGHESLLMVPMEPESYPQDDPGPHTLLTSLDVDANRGRLEWVLGRAAGYVGVMGAMGSRLTTTPEALRPILEALDRRGLMFLDDRSAPNSRAADLAAEVTLPNVVADRSIDDTASSDAIDRQLGELEQVARERGYAVGLAFPYPVTLDRLSAWIPTLRDKGIVLAPLSAIAAERLGDS